MPTQVLDPRMEFYLSEIPLDQLGEEHRSYQQVMKWLFECQEPLQIRYSVFQDRTRLNVPAKGPMLQYFFEYHCHVPKPGCVLYLYGEGYLRKFIGQPGLTVVPSHCMLYFRNQSDLHEDVEPRKLEIDQIFELHAPRLREALEALPSRFRD